MTDFVWKQASSGPVRVFLGDGRGAIACRMNPPLGSVGIAFFSDNGLNAPISIGARVSVADRSHDAPPEVVVYFKNVESVDVLLRVAQEARRILGEFPDPSEGGAA